MFEEWFPEFCSTCNCRTKKLVYYTVPGRYCDPCNTVYGPAGEVMATWYTGAFVTYDEGYFKAAWASLNIPEEEEGEGE